jgi:hypothetical protein
MGGTVYPWSSGHTLGTLITGIVVLIIFDLYGTALHPHLIVNLRFTDHLCRNIYAAAEAADTHAPISKLRL